MTVGPCSLQIAASPLRASGRPMNSAHSEPPVTSPPFSSLSPLRIGDFIVVSVLPFSNVTRWKMVLCARCDRVDLAYSITHRPSTCPPKRLSDSCTHQAKQSWLRSTIQRLQNQTQLPNLLFRFRSNRISLRKCLSNRFSVLILCMRRSAITEAAFTLMDKGRTGITLQCAENSSFLSASS